MGNAFGTYDVTLDGNKTSYSAWAADDRVSQHLFSASSLSAGPIHSISVANGNASMSLDFLKFTVDIGAPGYVNILFDYLLLLLPKIW